MVLFGYLQSNLGRASASERTCRKWSWKSYKRPLGLSKFGLSGWFRYMLGAIDDLGSDLDNDLGKHLGILVSSHLGSYSY